MKKIILLFLLIAGTAQAADASAPYYIPPAELNASLQVMDSGFANIIALFRTATGSFTFDDTNKSISNLRIAVDTTSLMTNSNESQRDLATMLGAFQFPEIRIMAPDSVTFTDNKAQIKATVLLHGASKQVTFDAVLNKTGKTPRTGSMWASEGEAVGLSLHGALKRADFGITDNPEAPARFGDTINLALEIQAIRQ